MSYSLKIRPNDGAVTLGRDVILSHGMDLALARKVLSNYYKANHDMENGYRWLSCNGAQFGGEICSFALGFLNDKLAEMHFGVVLETRDQDNMWPTKQLIDQEVNFMRFEMQRQLGRWFDSGQERFDWGVAWAQFDPKGFQATAGLRYVV